MIVENKYLEDIKRIWKENNSGYITEESNEMLINNDDILKIVYLENNVPAGYIAVYTKDDFCKLENFKGYKIYSCIAKDNIPSLKLHEKYGFKEAYQFTNDKEQLMLLKNN